MFKFSKMAKSLSMLENKNAFEAHKVLGTVDIESRQHAFSFLTALNELAQFDPNMTIADVFEFAAAAMPSATRAFEDQCAGRAFEDLI